MPLPVITRLSALLFIVVLVIPVKFAPLIAGSVAGNLASGIVPLDKSLALFVTTSKAVNEIISTTSPLTSVSPNTILVPFVAVMSAADTLTPFTYTSICPAVYASVTLFASVPLNVVTLPVTLKVNFVLPVPPAATSLKLKVPLPSVVSACPFVPSLVGYVNPETTRVVPFNNCKLSLLHLPVITFEPAFWCANSRIPSSVPSLASKIFPVIFAKTVLCPASLSPLNFSCPK